MPNTLLRILDLIEPGDLVIYHGSIPQRHGLCLARPCACAHCRIADHLGIDDPRYRLSDPFAEDPDALTLRCVRRKSITRSAANA